jgi:hypothetical protein
MDVVDPSGRPVRIWHEVESVAGDAPLRVDRASLRFSDVDTLASFLADAGFEIDAQYGGWLREPLEPASPEIITVARVERHARQPRRAGDPRPETTGPRA